MPKQPGTVRHGSGAKSVLLAAIGACRLGNVLGSGSLPLPGANTMVQIPWQDSALPLLFAVLLGFVVGAVLVCCVGLVILNLLWGQFSARLLHGDGGRGGDHPVPEPEPIRLRAPARDVGVQSQMTYARHRQQPRFVPSTGDTVDIGVTYSWMT